MRLVRWCAVMLLLPIGAAVGQEPTRDWRTVLVPGTSVRVTQIVGADTVRFESTVKAVRGDSLDLERESSFKATERRTIYVPDVNRIERKVKAPSQRAKHVAKGFGIGLAMPAHAYRWEPVATIGSRE